MIISIKATKYTYGCGFAMVKDATWVLVIGRLAIGYNRGMGFWHSLVRGPSQGDFTFADFSECVWMVPGTFT